MNLNGQLLPCGNRREAPGGAFVNSARSLRRRLAAFTLVEIALSVAIIGFALVAIIGVLPAGLNVQRDNREETIVVHDANYFMDAIRGGARGLDDLTNYVEAITNVVTRFDAQTNIVNVNTYGYTYTGTSLNGAAGSPNDVLTNGVRIIGLLSTPKYIFTYTNANSPHVSGFTSNYVVAFVRALNGPAVEKAPQQSVAVKDLAFRYRLLTEIVPYRNWDIDWVDAAAAQNLNLPPAEIAARSNYWQTARMLENNMHEVRLLFRWPVNSRREPGNQRQAFRTVIGGALTNQSNTPRWFVQPGTYQTPL